MSYAISARAATKALALAALAAKFDETVTPTQPVHAKDRDQALAAAESFVGVLADDDTKDVSITLNGWLSWQGASTTQPEAILGASVTVNASLVTREG